MISPNFVTKKMESSLDYGKFILEPLSPSFGQSIGNALRRTILSSLKGAAIVAVKIEDVPHLFSSIKGVKETALELVLNLKLVRFTLPGEERTYKILLSKKGVGKIYAKDIEGELEVVNKDLYLGEITDPKGKIELEAFVEQGYGYIPAEEQQNKEFGFINIDSSFSPVKKVNFKIEDARVGRKTNYDRLILEILTDGSISPEEALKKASEIISAQFNHILAVSETGDVKSEVAATSGTKVEIDKKFYDLIIDELNLPSRVVNALLRENIETVADLIKIGEDKLVVFKGLGKKSIELIKDELKKLGVEWK